MKICVIGLGYIGLPTAILLSEKNEVVGVDVKKDVVDKINDKIMPFKEPGLDRLLEQSGITASTTPRPADAFIICVPTPFDKEVRMADLKFVRSAVESIVPHLRKGNIVILESTVSPGACINVLEPILEKSGLKAGEDYYLAHCPERAIPGNTLHEMAYNDRIIGGIDDASTQLARKIYATFVKGNIYTTDITTAEFVKLMENTYRDVNIALANELAILAEEAKINIWEAISLANHHPRVNILKPGPGVGGHCIAVDPWFLTEATNRCRIINTAREINDSMPAYVLSKVKVMTENIRRPKITVFGVAYKGNVDDARETPALKFIKLAESEGFFVSTYDPLVSRFEMPLSSMEDAVRGTDCIVIISDHDLFKELDFGHLLDNSRHRNVLDTRNVVKSDGTFNLVKLGCSENAHPVYVPPKKPVSMAKVS
ncbi:UDP-glucose/GDP-mannose dehydrogenase family protein [Methanocella paludicola SANAE]|uniref:UDP-N-acetyl-D-mannosamine dehydrogenase n=2 Tax=Methanocella TaxID=570266 RepID=D1Z1P4_METPS|nr:nucleotide sugar dehydrogenase [Methanocella paludicola]BAI62616.1 UDP-glucose/GDP-mannose dehydrogenase family protein [Methanocella paludicola SANAE]